MVALAVGGAAEGTASLDPVAEALALALALALVLALDCRR